MNVRISHVCVLMLFMRWRSQAKAKLVALYAFMEATSRQLSVKVEDMATLKRNMDVLREFRAEESHIDMIITPILDMYQVCDCAFPWLWCCVLEPLFMLLLV